MSYQDEVLADSPLAYWRLSEASGTLADSSGNGKTLSQINTPTLGASGPFDAEKAVALNGTTQYLQSDQDIAHSDYTIEFWYKGTDAAGRLASARGTSASSYSITVGLGATPVTPSGPDGSVFIGLDGNGRWAGVHSGSTVVNDNAWHHIACVWDGSSGTAVDASQLKIYIDGVSVSTTASVFSTQSAPISSLGTGYALGASPGASEFVSGSFSNFALYGTPLSAARVAAHYGDLTSEATSYSADVLALSPLGYWRLGETSGTSATDASGNGRTGTYAGSPTLGTAGLLTGDPNTAVTFDGVNDAVSIPATGMDSGDFTVLAWIKTSTAAKRQIVSRWVNGGGQRWTLQLEASGNPYFYCYDGGYHSAGIATNIANGARHMVAATVSGNAITLYLDGSSVATGSKSGALSGSAVGVTIGSTSDPAEFFNGVIDEPAIFGTALTATQIGNLWTSGNTAPAASISLSLADTIPALDASLTLASYTDTATSNDWQGRVRGGSFQDESEEPVEPLPAGLVRAVRVDKALAYPTPTIIDGRPT